ncbi:CdaR family protein [Sporosarcina sp. FA9]|uniref:CdaR family protein n=1 Tax=Sporosarcina sp. FA9 TaxID=3413030 RepID=UPI003F6565FE
MDKLMDSPWFLRITALFLAIVLFFSVKAMDVNINGKTPGDQVDSIHDIPVEVFYDNENLVVTGVPASVKMAIEGPPNIVQTTKLLKDFTIFVDLNNLPMGKHQVELQSENISEKLHVRLDPATIDVLIEEKVTQTFRVDPELNERLLAEDFQVVNMEVNPATVEVTGAKSVIEAISFVKVTSTRDGGINKSFEQKARVRVLDKDLNKLNVIISPEEVSVKVEIAEYNKDVPIDLRSRGTKKPGVEIGTLTPSETKINISGPRKVLDNINILTVDVDISGVIGPETFDINLKKPKGVSSMSLDKIKVKVEATETVIDEDTASSDNDDEAPSIGTRIFNNMQIVVRGLDDKYKSTFLKPVNGFLTLTVKAEPDVIEALEKSDFTVFVNMDDTTNEGEQVLSVSVDGPGDLQWLLSVNEVIMQIELA